MGNPNRNTGGDFMYSPAEGLADLPSPGAFSNPGQPSVHPDFSMTDKSGDTPVGSKPAEEYAGMAPDKSAGNSAGVSLADAPDTPTADLGQQLGGDLNTIPKPIGSY